MQDYEDFEGVEAALPAPTVDPSHIKLQAARLFRHLPQNTLRVTPESYKYKGNLWTFKVQYGRPGNETTRGILKLAAYWDAYSQNPLVFIDTDNDPVNDLQRLHAESVNHLHAYQQIAFGPERQDEGIPNIRGNLRGSDLVVPIVIYWPNALLTTRRGPSVGHFAHD
jgi:hypothetical protein